MNIDYIRKAVSKAAKSSCRYKISAMGFDKKGEFVGITTNQMRFSRPGGGSHAEAMLIRRYRGVLKTIVICRTNNSGDTLLPIHPCANCSELARKYGIKIKTVTDC